MTFRRTLTINFVLSILVLLGLTLVIIVSYGARGHASELAKESLQAQADSIYRQADVFFNQVEDSLRVSQSHVTFGLIDLQNHVDINELKAPLVEQSEALSSVLIATEDGQEYLLLQRPDGWMNRLTKAGQREEERSKLIHWSKDFAESREEHMDRPYASATRPWYQLGKTLEIGEIAATEPYIFFTTKEPGLTIVTRAQRKDKSLPPLVLAYDVLLKDCSAFTKSIRFARRGNAFLATDDGRMIGMPASESRPDLLLEPLERLENPVFASAFDAVESGRQVSDAPFQIEVEGESWWCLVHSVRAGGQRFWVGVVAPDEDYSAGILNRRNWVILAIVIALLASWGNGRSALSPLCGSASQTGGSKQTDRGAGLLWRSGGGLQNRGDSRGGQRAESDAQGARFLCPLRSH